jgi:hypothetical protein
MHNPRAYYICMYLPTTPALHMYLYLHKRICLHDRWVFTRQQLLPSKIIFTSKTQSWIHCLAFFYINTFDVKLAMFENKQYNADSVLNVIVHTDWECLAALNSRACFVYSVFNECAAITLSMTYMQICY